MRKKYALFFLLLPALAIGCASVVLDSPAGDDDDTAGDTDTDVDSDSGPDDDGGPGVNPNAVPCTAEDALDLCGSAALCIDGYCCDTPCTGVCEICNRTGLEGICSYAPNTVPCRNATNVCDAVEFCTGTSATCPVDGIKSAGEPCREAADLCDAVEYCNGIDVDFCPADGVLPDGGLCRPAATDCDVPEYCNGVNLACPADQFKPIDTACGNPTPEGDCDLFDKCDDLGNCLPNYRPDDYECNAPAPDPTCELPALCPGDGPNCPPNPLKAVGVECRGAIGGDCDVADTCSGSSAVCVDNYEASGVACRAQTDPICDLADECTGDSPVCPDDKAGHNGVTECRTAAPCDPADYCNNGACPANVAEIRFATDFNSGIPGDWEIWDWDGSSYNYDATPNGNSWTYRSSGGPSPSDGHAVADSSGGFGGTGCDCVMHEGLLTPWYDMSGCTHVSLAMNHDYDDASGDDDAAYIKVIRSATGTIDIYNEANWATAQVWAGGDASGSYAPGAGPIPDAGTSEYFRFRFEYNGNSDEFWAIDDVVVVGTKQ